MNPILIPKTHCKTTASPRVRIFALAAGTAMLLLAGVSSSCATAAGFGRDVEHTGEEIQEAVVN